MYDPSKQYRCTIIRGKSQKKWMIFARICKGHRRNLSMQSPRTIFETLFNEAFKRYLPESEHKKTLDNHRTEISGKLFGMYYFAEDDSF